jgi:NAD(P)H-nitrite reductase large subunit
MNAIGFWGLHLLTAGSYEGESYYGQAATPGTDAALSGKAPAAAYKRLVVRDNRLVGFILIGDVACAGIYTALIRERTPLDTVDFDLIRERPRLIAFSKVERAKMLGGAAS